MSSVSETKIKSTGELENATKKIKLETIQDPDLENADQRLELLALPIEVLCLIAEEMDAHTLLNFNLTSKYIFNVTNPVIIKNFWLQFRDWDHKDGHELKLDDLKLLFETTLIREYRHFKMSFKFSLNLLTSRFLMKHGNEIKSFSLEYKAICYQTNNTASYIISLFKFMPNVEEIFIDSPKIIFNIKTENSESNQLTKVWTKKVWWCKPINIFDEKWFRHLRT